MNQDNRERGRAACLRGRCLITSRSYIITHYYHSGFSVSCENTLLVFDYWRGEEGELTEELQITPEKIRKYDSVVVFISHEHMDHMDPVVYSWKDLTRVSYVVSSDMPVGTRGKRMAPGDTFDPAEGVRVTAFDSTDLGVSFLVDFQGLKFFHAGDLNFWHWREESTMQQIDEADAEFRKAMIPVSREHIDIAFFPLDPRQGSMFEAGANYFIMSAKPRIMIPMHYFHRSEVAVDYARSASCRTTEVLALPMYGDCLVVEAEDDGYLNVRYVRQGEYIDEDQEGAGSAEGGSGADQMWDDGEDVLDANNPFAESDLPVNLDSQEDDV